MTCTKKNSIELMIKRRISHKRLNHSTCTREKNKGKHKRNTSKPEFTLNVNLTSDEPYNALTDKNLFNHFSNFKLRKHLLKMKLINKYGKLYKDSPTHFQYKGKLPLLKLAKKKLTNKSIVVSPHIKRTDNPLPMVTSTKRIYRSSSISSNHVTNQRPHFKRYIEGNKLIHPLSSLELQRIMNRCKEHSMYNVKLYPNNIQIMPK